MSRHLPVLPEGLPEDQGLGNNPLLISVISVIKLIGPGIGRIIMMTHHIPAVVGWGPSGRGPQQAARHEGRAVSHHQFIITGKAGQSKPGECNLDCVYCSSMEIW